MARFSEKFSPDKVSPETAAPENGSFARKRRCKLGMKRVKSNREQRAGHMHRESSTEFAMILPCKGFSGAKGHLQRRGTTR